MRHFVNVVALVFAVALFSLFFYNDKIKITQEVLDLFPQTEDKQIIDIYQKFANSNHILVAIKGFSQESRDTLDEFLSKIKDMPNIDSVITRTSASESLEDFLAQDYLYTASPKPLDKVLTKEEIESRVLNGLQSLQSQMLEEEVLDSGLIDMEKMRDSKDIESKQSVDSNKDSKKENIDLQKDSITLLQTYDIYTLNDLYKPACNLYELEAIAKGLHKKYGNVYFSGSGSSFFSINHDIKE